MRLQIPKVRDERIDSVKFWLIVLVITAHVTMRKEFTGSVACPVLWNWLCIFAIPLFVCISGYYSRKKDWQAFWPGIWKLLEPLIIFHVIALVFYVKHPLSIRSILSPWYMLWYLLSLTYWRFMLQVLPDRILNHKKTVLTTAFCISILAGFLPFDRILSLQRTLSLMPFFFLGYYIRMGGGKFLSARQVQAALYRFSDCNICRFIHLSPSHNLSVICYPLQKHLWSGDTHAGLCRCHSDVYSVYQRLLSYTVDCPAGRNVHAILYLSWSAHTTE